MFAFLLAAVTFADIAPLLAKHCVGCHRSGEIGPMPLTTHAEARPWAKAIRQAVLTKRMPPWFAAGGSLQFANDPSLTQDEVRRFDEWARGGAPPGAAKIDILTRPPAADLLLTMPNAVRVPAKQELDYVYVALPLGLPADRWVQSVEVRPGARRAVHHAVVYIRERGDPWPESGPRVTTNDILALYAPGQPPSEWPSGMAKKIPAGADLVLQMHYTPTGRVEEDRTAVAVTWAKEPPSQRVLTLQLHSTRFLIPAGDPHHRLSVSGTLPNDALLLGLFPHLHLRGKAFEYAIAEGEGRLESLLRVAPYDFYWQLYYRLKQPRPLLKGTRLIATAWWDNSANNLRNPDPSADVRYGEQSRDEMMVAFFDVAVPAGVDKKTFFLR
ncbi:MAG: cytochrome c [Bryobacteraceae bacterium]|nr:cytochrome c [Bryobacteraceae bacterium]